MKKHTLFLLKTIKTDQGSAFGECIKKNYAQIFDWAKRSKTDCFRIYDRELPDYSLAIDVYAGYFAVQYFSKHANEEPSAELVANTTQTLCTLFGAPAHVICWRTRARAKETRQHEKAGESKAFFTAMEYGLTFKINLLDYLDTGLFLDHRETRQRVASMAKGKRLLNLFSYTASFSVHAAAAGAAFTKSVDMSNTYNSWAKDNFILNGFSSRNNEIVRADCLKFLNEELRAGIKYDIIVIDPPTISRSKKMDQLFDIQVDYISLISKSLRLLSKGGVLFFSTNSRKFSFDETLFKNFTVKEISKETIPIDFQDTQIHRAYEITDKKKFLG